MELIGGFAPLVSSSAGEIPLRFKGSGLCLDATKDLWYLFGGVRGGEIVIPGPWLRFKEMHDSTGSLLVRILHFLSY